MKNIWIVLVLSLLNPSFLSANEIIPKVVTASFVDLYPEVNNPFWERRFEGMVATFKGEEGLKQAFFNLDGEWLETRLKIDREDLPFLLDQYLINNYLDADITFCGRVYTANNGWFLIESEYTDRVVIKKLRADGTLISERTIVYSLDKAKHQLLDF